MHRTCRRCGCEIRDALGNRVKFVGRENARAWIFRHIRQFFSLIVHGFVRPEIEGYVELCDSCFKNLNIWLEKGPAKS